MTFFSSRSWIIVRRIVLISLVFVIAYQNYSGTVGDWFSGPDAKTDLIITHTEFRTDLEGDLRPVWFMGIQNQSRDTAYDNIVLEATYSDGITVLERDQIVIDQRLLPGQEELVGTRDSSIRQGAIQGSLRVLDADVVN